MLPPLVLQRQRRLVPLIISSGLGAGGGRALPDVDCRSVDFRSIGFRGFLAALPSLGAAPASSPASGLAALPCPLSGELVRRANLALSLTPEEAAASTATALSRPLVEQRTRLDELLG